jgi:hypothetical protein
MPNSQDPDFSGQLGNAERGRAHWPLDLELHPDLADSQAAARVRAPSSSPRRNAGAPVEEAPEQLGNAERGRAHWPLDLELHPDREEDRQVTHPLNPPPERISTRRAQDDERPGS